MVYCYTGSTDIGSRIVMSQTAAASFLADVRVFDRREYAAAVGRAPDDPAVGAMLDWHVRAREIKHVAEDIYGALPKGCKHPDRYPVPPYLVAGRLRPGAVLAYHSALDIHGHAYSLTHCIVHAFAPTGHAEFAIDGRFYNFFEPPPGIVLGGERPADGIEIVARMGVDIRVTTLERTLADLFDRPVLGGDSLIEAIDFADDLDDAAMVRHMRTLDNAAAAGAMGFWLESLRGRRRVDEAAIRELRDFAPREPMYAMGARPGKVGGCLLVDDWNVILPKRFVVPEIHGDLM